LVLLDADFSMRRHGVEILLDLERYVLSQHFHGVDHAADVKAEVLVLEDAQEFPVSFFEQEFAFPLKDAYIDVTALYIIISELDDVDGERQVYNSRQLLNRVWHIVDDARAEDVQNKIAESRFAFAVWLGLASSLAIYRLILEVLVIDELKLRLLSKFNRFLDHAGKVNGQIDFHVLQALIVRLLKMVSHHNRIQKVACS